MAKRNVQHSQLCVITRNLPIWSALLRKFFHPHGNEDTNQ